LKVLIATSSRTIREGLPKLREMIPVDCDFIVPKTGSDEELASLAKDVEVILCVRLSAAVVNAAEKLRLIQKTGAGVDAIPFDSFKDRDIHVANTSGTNAIPVAEGAFALIIALAKRIVPRHIGMQRGDIRRERGILLKGKTLGILGLGSIGTEVAKRGQAFGMKVVAMKRHPTQEKKEELGLTFLGGSSDLRHILETSDFVVVTLPLTPETRGLIGESELKVMKKTSYLVNIARAAIIQEESLYRALKEKWIAGAALDVWYTPHWWDPKWRATGGQTQPSRYPIHKLENVIATPHNIGSTGTSSPETLEIIAENITRIAKGEAPINQVDRILQY
jgi:D-3-phosphoglycerate dehydrogenase